MSQNTVAYGEVDVYARPVQVRTSTLEERIQFLEKAWIELEERSKEQEHELEALRAHVRELDARIFVNHGKGSANQA